MRRGFTLIELLVSLSVGMILLSIMIGVTLKTSSLLAKAQGLSHRRDQMVGALMQIKREAEQWGIDRVLSTSSQLALADPTHSIRYDGFNGKVRRQKGGSAGYLTSDDFPVVMRFVLPSTREARAVISSSHPAWAMEMKIETR